MINEHYNFRIKIVFYLKIFILLLSEVLAKSLTDWYYRQAKSILIYKKILLY